MIGWIKRTRIVVAKWVAPRDAVVVHDAPQSVIAGCVIMSDDGPTNRPHLFTMRKDWGGLAHVHAEGWVMCPPGSSAAKRAMEGAFQRIPLAGWSSDDIKRRLDRLSKDRADAVRKKARRSHIDAEMQSLRTALLKLEQGK